LVHPEDHRVVPGRRCPQSEDFRQPSRKKGMILKKPRKMRSQTRIYQQTTIWSPTWTMGSPNATDARVQKASVRPTPDDGHKVPRAASATVHLAENPHRFESPLTTVAPLAPLPPRKPIGRDGRLCAARQSGGVVADPNQISPRHHHDAPVLPRDLSISHHYLHQ
jgi:hypothetical protein